MHLRGTGYALTASLMFGFGVVLAKLLSGEIDAVLVAFLSLSIGGLLLTGFLLFTGNSLFYNLSVLNRADWINIFLLSCIGTALPLLLIVAGFTRTSALEGGFILQLNGMAALIFALLLLHERFRLRQGLGILLLLVGSTLVVLKGSQGGVDWKSGGLGNLLILAGAIGLGFGFIPAKRLSERIETLQLTALRLLLGAATLLPIVAFQVLFESFRLESFQETVTGLVAVVWASRRLDLTFGVGDILLFAAWAASGAAIYLAIFIGLTATSFWIEDRIGISPPVFNLMQFGRYPLTIYDAWVRFALSFVIPFAFASFYPTIRFLRREEFLAEFWLVPAVAAISLTLALSLWKSGEARYHSTGT